MLYICKLSNANKLMSKIYTTETIIEQFKEKNKHSFDYSKVEYVNMNADVCVTCNIHGDMWLKPFQILRNCCCPKCRSDKLSESRTTKEQFIKKATEIHDGKYIYTDVDYKGVMEKVCIICPIHGKFQQTPHIHLQGSGCPKCGLKSRVEKRTNTMESFIKREKEVHGDKYDISKAVYVNNHTKVCLICHQKDNNGVEHGEFWQTPDKHLRLRQGCPKCSKNRKSNTEEFIEKAKLLPNSKNVGFDNVEYINNKTKVCLTCFEKDENGVKHGDFMVTPHNFLLGRGCPKCKNRRISESETKTNEQYIKEITEVHGGKYDVSKVEYLGAKKKVCLICSIHGEFWQDASSHLSGCGCPKCVGQVSKAEEEIKQFILENFDVEILSNKRDVLSDGKELDIYIPSLNVAFEYDGMIWHSERFNKNKDYHLNKTLDCLKQGIKLYHVYEYEWLNKKSAVQNNILQILNYYSNNSIKVTIISKICLIDGNKAEEFLEQYNIQGFISSDLYIGSFVDGKLVSVMSLNKGKEANKWLITRITVEGHISAKNVSKKAFQWFVENYSPNTVSITLDRRWDNGDIFEGIGFKLNETLQPTFACTRSPNEYLNGITIIMDGFYKIWNCGYLKYQWKISDFA
jgi:hypothetical protein